jgi:hypothetical protein
VGRGLHKLIVYEYYDFKRLCMVSVPCIVDISNGFFLFILSLCRLVVFREHILVFFRKFWIVSVRFETVLFVSVVSIKVRNTETNRNFFFLVSRNKPKQTRNRSCFGLFRFEPKFIFVCFEDTLVPPYPVPASECVSPLGSKMGGSNTCLRLRGRGDPMQKTGQKAWHSVSAATCKGSQCRHC